MSQSIGNNFGDVGLEAGSNRAIPGILPAVAGCAIIRPMVLADEEFGRLNGEGLVRPNAAHQAAGKPDGSIRLIEVTSEEVPLVAPRMVDGCLVGADLPLDRAKVAAAIRAERDA